MTIEFTPQLAVAIIVSIPLIVIFLLLAVMPEWRMRALGTSYYKIHIKDGRIVNRTVILKAKEDTVYLDARNHVAWIIPSADKLITINKNDLLFFADIRSCVGITPELPEYEQLKKAIQKAKNPDSIIRAIPIINTFYTTHSKKIDALYGYESEKDGKKVWISGKTGWAAKVKLNPDFMIDAITFFNINTQKITDKIIKNPVSMWEMLERNLPIIVIGIVILVIAYLLSSR